MQQDLYETAFAKRRMKEASNFNKDILRNIIVLQILVIITAILSFFLIEKDHSILLPSIMLSVALIASCLVLRLLVHYVPKLLGYIDLILIVLNFVAYSETNYFFVYERCVPGSIR